MTKSSDTKKIHENENSDDRKIVLLMGMGLNGIDADGWIPPTDTKVQAEEMINDLWQLLDTVDTFIIGRVTFQMWENYWPLQAKDPTSSGFRRDFSLFADKVDKIAVSNTLENVTWPNSKIIKGDIQSEISRLKKLPGKNIALVGGPSIAQSFTKLNLIDDYQIYLHPVIYVSGKSVLGSLDKERKLDLIETKIFQSGGMRIHLRPTELGFM